MKNHEKCSDELTRYLAIEKTWPLLLIYFIYLILLYYRICGNYGWSLLLYKDGGDSSSMLVDTILRVEARVCSQFLIKNAIYGRKMGTTSPLG